MTRWSTKTLALATLLTASAVTTAVYLTDPRDLPAVALWGIVDGAVLGACWLAWRRARLPRWARVVLAGVCFVVVVGVVAWW